METRELQELLLATMPLWHIRINRPFKKQLDERVSLGMYYCIRQIQQHNGTVTMSELARSARCPKQQMTKTVGKLIECRFAERISDPADRRVIRLRLTEEGLKFSEQFLTEDAAYFRNMLDSLSPEDKEEFGRALRSIHRILMQMPRDPECRKQI